MLKKILLICVGASLVLSCKKDPVVPNPPTSEQYGVPFAEVPAPEDAVIYQVNMRVFSQQGNFEGVRARLDSISALGVNVIYLMPIYPVGTVNAFNSPYCVRNYRTVNSEFGTLGQLRELVAAAHARHMAVILDWVANHTAWDHPWTSDHPDWYQQDGSGTIIHPPGTNWNDVAQLNFNNAEMRLEMIQSMRLWVMTANVDGFRCDYADGPPTDFWTQAIDSLRGIATHDLLLLAEGSQSRHFTEGFDYIFGFNYFGNLKTVFGQNLAVSGLDNLDASEYVNATGSQQVVRYTSNHDVNGSDGTPLELFGGRDGSMAAFVAVALGKGVPMIYGGQEVGTPIRLTFPFTSTKINWSLNPDMVAEYKKIIGFRKLSPTVRRGTRLSYSNHDICAFTKELDGHKVLVIDNLRNATLTFPLPSLLANTTWIDALVGGQVHLGTQITLAPFQYWVLRN